MHISKAYMDMRIHMCSIRRSGENGAGYFASSPPISISRLLIILFPSTRSRSFHTTKMPKRSYDVGNRTDGGRGKIKSSVSNPDQSQSVYFVSSRDLSLVSYEKVYEANRLSLSPLVKFLRRVSNLECYSCFLSQVFCAGPYYPQF